MRGYIFVRVEEGKPDVRATFPEDRTSYADAIRWCESEGCRVAGHRIEETPTHKDFAAIVYVYVLPRKEAGAVG